MKKIIALATLGFIMAEVSVAGSVLWDIVNIQRLPSETGEENATWTLWAEEERYDPVISLGVAFSSSNASDGSMILTGENTVLWPPQILSLVQYGEEINHDTILGSRFIDNCIEDSIWHKIAIPAGESIILGFATGVDGSSMEPSDDYWTYYGWATLHYDGYGLSLTASAIAIDSEGIYAGSGNIVPRAIPEPSTTALILIGLVAVGACRRRAATNHT